METKTLEKELQDIHQKLDFISDQMRDYQQRQKEMSELKSDLSLIAKAKKRFKISFVILLRKKYRLL